MVLPIGPQTPGTRGPGSVGDRAATGGGFAPIIAILPRQLQNSALQQLAGQTTAARLLSLSAGGLAQIEVRGAPMEVRLKNVPAGQNPGDTVLINFRTDDMPDDPGALTIRGASVDRSGGLRNTEALRSDANIPKAAGDGLLPLSSEQRLSDAARLLGALSRIDNASETPYTIDVVLTGTEGPEANAANKPMAGRNLSDATSMQSTAGVAGGAAAQSTDQAIARFAAQAMQDMMKSIETSGLFYESHLMQWNEGDRTEEDIRSEPQASWGPEDALDDGALTDSGSMRESTRTVAAQLAQLERPAMHMTLPGFFNDRVELVIEQDKKPPRESKQPPAWFATLRMDLPNLGPLEMRVTLLDSQCHVTVKTSPQSRTVVSAGFAELMDTMSAAGLKLTAQASTQDESNDTA